MIKKIFINLLILVLAVLLQSTLLQRIAFYGAIPDLVLVIVLFFSLKEGSKVGEISGFLGGLLLDFISLSPLGFHGLIYCLIGFIAGLTSKNVSTDSIMTQIVFVFLALILKTILSTLIIILFTIDSTSLSFISQKILMEFAYTILVTPVFFVIANKIYSIGHRKRAGF